MRRTFDIPKVVAFIDNGEFDNISEITKDMIDDEAYRPYVDYGIAYDDYIICLCCGSVIPLRNCIFCKELDEIGAFNLERHIDIDCIVSYKFDEDECLTDIIIEQ